MTAIRTGSFFRYVNIVFFVLLNIAMIYPFWHTLVGSMISFEEYSGHKLLLFPHRPTFEAYREIFERGDIFRPLQITVFITVVGTVASLFATAWTAYGLSKDFLGSKVIMTIIVLTLFFNGGLIPQYLLFKKLHLLNSVWVYIVPVLINTFFLIIMRTNFSGFPKEVEESAKVDGCNEFGIFFRIILPLAKPLLATIGLFYAVNFWNTFLASLMFVPDIDKKTLYEYIYKIVSNQEGSQFATSVAFGESTKFANIVIAVAPIMIVYPFLQKYFVNGTMVGAVKG